MISVIVPTRNERENAELLLYCLVPVLESVVQDRFEVMVVDDSTDDTFEYLTARFGKFRSRDRMRFHHRERSTGLATAIGDGVGLARGRQVLVMDSDFNHSPLYVPAMVDLAQEADVVIGSRFVQGGDMIGARLRYRGSYLFNQFIRAALGVRTRDNLSGFWIMEREKALELNRLHPIFHGYGDYFIRLLYLANRTGLKVREIPVRYLRRLMGDSGTNLPAELVRYTRTTLEMRRLDPRFPRRGA